MSSAPQPNISTSPAPPPAATPSRPPHTPADAAISLLHPSAQQYARLAGLSVAEARYASIIYDAISRAGATIPDSRQAHQAIIDTACLIRRTAEQLAPPAPALEQQRPAAPITDPFEIAGIPKDLVSVQMAAQSVGFHPRTLYIHIRSGKLRAFGRAPNLRVSLSDLMPLAGPSNTRPAAPVSSLRRGRVWHRPPATDALQQAA